MGGFIPDGFVTIHTYLGLETKAEMKDAWVDDAHEIFRPPAEVRRSIAAKRVRVTVKKRKLRQLGSGGRTRSEATKTATDELMSVIARRQRSLAPVKAARDKIQLKLTQDLYAGRLAAHVINPESGALEQLPTNLWGTDAANSIWETGEFCCRTARGFKESVPVLVAASPSAPAQDREMQNPDVRQADGKDGRPESATSNGGEVVEDADGMPPIDLNQIVGRAWDFPPPGGVDKLDATARACTLLAVWVVNHPKIFGKLSDAPKADVAKAIKKTGHQAVRTMGVRSIESHLRLPVGHVRARQR